MVTLSFVSTLALLTVVAGMTPDVTVVDIHSSATLSETSDGFICVNLDWWPSSKCDYGRCPWGDASLLNLDLSSPKLRVAMQALSQETPNSNSLTLRLGGSMADYIQYNTSAEAASKCVDWTITNDTRLGYVLFDRSRRSGGTNATGTVVGKCLQPQRLLDLFSFCEDVSCRIAFGVAAMQGRWLKESCPAGTDCWHGKPTPQCCTSWDGAWDPTNTRELLSVLKDKGVTPWALEFGNELAGKGGIEAQISPEKYYADFVNFANMVRTLWPAADGHTPYLVTPDSAWDDAWQAAFMALAPPADIISRHEYTLGAGVDPASAGRVTDPASLDKLKRAASVAAKTFNTAAPGLAKSIPPAHKTQGFPQLWMGEGGGCYNSGRPNVTNAFMSSFWYLDNMAVEAQRSHAAFCRQTLVGGSYSLLDTDTLVPNPDFFAARLWRRLMGTSVLNVSMPASSSSALRIYAHCLAGDTAQKGGVAVLILNLNASAEVKVDTRGLFGGPLSSLRREEYHMAAPNGEDIHSRVVSLNGVSLTTANASLSPRVVNAGSEGAVSIAPLTYAFVALPEAQATACKASPSREAVVV